MDRKSAVIIDVGTGFTKMGFGGNVHPSFVVPTALATRPVTDTTERSEMDFFMGDDAVGKVPLYDVTYPVKRGIVTDWSQFEKIMYGCVCRYLQVDPTEHPFVLTEPPLNPPENRESLAEIMFEMFQVPSLYIGVQAVLALYGMNTSADAEVRSYALMVLLSPKEASWATSEAEGRAGADASTNAHLASLHNLTGTVVESGDGCTHVVPVVNGYVVGSSIKSVPLAGSNITALVQSMQRERREPLPNETSLDVCRAIKERHCYTAKDVASERAKMDADPGKHVKTFAVQRKTGPAVSVNVAHERFLAPEAFFNPAVANLQCASLPELVDASIQACTIDSRRALYNSIFLSGGSTLFRNFDKRLQLEVSSLVNRRLSPESSGVAVNVIRHPLQRYSVWFGASLLSVAPNFVSACTTKAQYEEFGPSICRRNHVFSEESM